MRIRHIFLGLLALLVLPVLALFARDELVTHVWLGPSQLEQYERGSLVLYLRPENEVLLLDLKGGGKVDLVHVLWRGTIGNRWVGDLYHWPRNVPVPGPNWRVSEGLPVMMHWESVGAANETSLHLVTFGDDYLKIDETRFDRVETDHAFYCGSISLAHIEDYEDSPC